MMIYSFQRPRDVFLFLLVHVGSQHKGAAVGWALPLKLWRSQSINNNKHQHLLCIRYITFLSTEVLKKGEGSENILQNHTNIVMYKYSDEIFLNGIWSL